MAKMQSKGTVFQIDIASTLTSVAQVISLEGPTGEAETYEADTLDNSGAGILYLPTGRTEGGSISGELFFDPVAATHQAITDLLTTPGSDTTSCNIIYTDSAATEWPFEVAGFTFGSVTVDLADGVKASFGGKLSGIPTYPS